MEVVILVAIIFFILLFIFMYGWIKYKTLENKMDNMWHAIYSKADEKEFDKLVRSVNQLEQDQEELEK